MTLDDVPAPQADALRVALADDSLLVREGVARLLDDAGFTVVARVEDPATLLEAVRADPPDVAIVDVRASTDQPDEGAHAAREIRRELPDVGLLVLTEDVDAELAALLAAESTEAAGVGCLLRDRVADVRDFTEAVRQVGEGGSVIDPDIVLRLMAEQETPLSALSDREREVLTLMAEGHSNRAIAERMFVSLKTVEGHVRRIFTKLDLHPTPAVHRRVLAVLLFLRSSAAPYAT